MRRRRRTPPRAIALVVAAGLAVAACSSTATPWTPPPDGGDGGSAQRITVTLTDALRIEMQPLTLKAGSTVTFVVTNAGKLEHEIFLGSKSDQDLHEEEMQKAGTMVHDHDNGIGVKPGQTRELTHTFTTAGTVIAGCHVPGHYGAGMSLEITVQP